MHSSWKLAWTSGWDQLELVGVGQMDWYNCSSMVQLWSTDFQQHVQLVGLWLPNLAKYWTELDLKTL